MDFVKLTSYYERIKEQQQKEEQKESQDDFFKPIATYFAYLNNIHRVDSKMQSEVNYIMDGIITGISA